MCEDNDRIVGLAYRVVRTALRIVGLAYRVVDRAYRIVGAALRVVWGKWGLRFLLGGSSTVKFKGLGLKYVKILEVVLIYRRRSIRFL